jgi:flavin reductase (DIM6/NTAB) family NADH-FMN oxidoreductase RutF
VSDQLDQTADDTDSATSEAFDALMGSLDTPVAVVTTASGGERAGCLIGFHSQCGINPGRVAVWLSKANHTYRVGLLAERFAVHFLTEDDVDVAELFGTFSGDDIDKFTRCDWTAGEGGVPLLDRCPNRVVARRLALEDHGSDHTCIVLHPHEATTSGPFSPLRFSAVKHLDAGHPVDDRPTPPTERSD